MVRVECVQCLQTFATAGVDGLITCPHCQAEFRQAPEALAAAQGWDRSTIRSLVEAFRKEQDEAEASGLDTAALQDEQLDRVLRQIASLPAAESLSPGGRWSGRGCGAAVGGPRRAAHADPKAISGSAHGGAAQARPTTARPRP